MTAPKSTVAGASNRPGPTAEVTFTGQDVRTGAFKVTTKRGHTVIHHAHLNAAERDAILADPTAAHVRAWPITPLRRPS